MMSKKDTYRNFGIWIVLILFYFTFYFISNYAWIDQINIPQIDSMTSARIQPLSPHPYGSNSNTKSIKELAVDSNVIPGNVATKKEARKSSYSSRQIQFPKSISINSADQKEWETLYNIGPYRAEKIINFREALGGFYSIDQVGETYGLPDSVFQEIKPQLKMDTSYSHIYINQMSYDTLYQHPYITKQMAYFMVKYREEKKTINDMDDLYSVIQEKDHERLKKLEPYLDFGIR